MKARIAGLGQWLPPTVRENSEWPADFAERSKGSNKRELVDLDLQSASPEDALAARFLKEESSDPFLGTTRRRVADADVSAAGAECEAAKIALADADVKASEVDVVLSWSMVPDRVTPASASHVAHALGATNAYAMGVDAACATTLPQLEIAAALVESGRAKHVLLTQSHLMTRTMPMSHPASPNIGDAATAIVVSKSDRPGILGFYGRSHGEYFSAVTWLRGRENDPPWWQEGPACYLGSKNREEAQRLILSTVRIAANTIRDLLWKSDVEAKDVALLASVQPRRWVPGAIASSIGSHILAPQTFDELAHLGGCGVVTNLIHARDHLKPGMLSVLYAQGAGFIRSSVLVRW